MTDDQRDLFAGMAERDRILGRYRGTEFTALVRDATAHLRGRYVTGEDIAFYCQSMGITPPHPNAWGGAINALVRSGQLEATGRYRKMRKVSSHARETKVYLVK